MTTTITICETCRLMGREIPEGNKRDGARLAEMIEQLAGDGGNTGDAAGAVAIRRISCLMGCKHGCNVAIQAAGKLTYVLGRFEPKPGAAEAILEYARLHAASRSGQVPFRQWPQGVKGHFVARIPPIEPEPGTGADTASAPLMP